MTIASQSVLARRTRYGAWLGVVVALSSLPAQASDQITFVSQGGAYQKAQTVAILDPAAKKLDITVNQDSIPDAWPVIKTQVASGKPTWDVVDVPTGYCLRGGEQGLIEKLDFAKLPNAAAMPENYRSPYSVAYEFYSSVLAYSQTKYPAGATPDSWADFLRRVSSIAASKIAVPVRSVPRKAASSASRSSGGTTRLTRPRSRAVSASMKSPVSSISNAGFWSTLRDSPTAGVAQKSPRLIPDTANRASLLATARSHMATSWQPAAVATPWTRAMTGCGRC